MLNGGVARTCSVGPQFVPYWREKAADLQNRSALRVPSKSDGRLKRTPHPPPCGPPSPPGRGGTARRWVRGPFVGDISIALEVFYARDFDGALGPRYTFLTFHDMS